MDLNYMMDLNYKSYLFQEEIISMIWFADDVPLILESENDLEALETMGEIMDKINLNINKMKTTKIVCDKN